jgi:hypothetical protein
MSSLLEDATEATRERRTKVSGEGEDLLADQHVQGVDGGIAEDLVPVDFVIGLFWDAKIFTRFWNIHFIALHRRVVRVMTVVRNSPREVRSPEEGVGDLAYFDSVDVYKLVFSHSKLTNPMTSLTIL